MAEAVSWKDNRLGVAAISSKTANIHDKVRSEIGGRIAQDEARLKVLYSGSCHQGGSRLHRQHASLKMSNRKVTND